MFWLFLIGAAVGAGLTAVSIFGNYVVKDRESWEKENREREAAHTCAEEVLADNVKLRVALAAAQMTPEAKQVAAVTMAALGDGIVGVESTE